MQSVPITTDVESSNLAHGEVYSIQHYVIKFVSDLQQIGGFLRLLWVSSTSITECQNITEILLKVAFNTKILIPNLEFCFLTNLQNCKKILYFLLFYFNMCSNFKENLPTAINSGLGNRKQVPKQRTQRYLFRGRGNLDYLLAMKWHKTTGILKDQMYLYIIVSTSTFPWEVLGNVLVD